MLTSRGVGCEGSHGLGDWVQVWRTTTTSIRSGVNIMSLLMLVQTSEYCMLLDVSHWSSQEGPWMPSTMWCMQVVCFSTSWWPASIAIVDARCTCHTAGGPTDESHWPLGDPSTAHHLRSVVSLPMLPSFKVLCILLSVCLWRSHRPRSCTLGGPIACVLSTPGGPTAMITCLNMMTPQHWHQSQRLDRFTPCRVSHH